MASGKSRKSGNEASDGGVLIRGQLSIFLLYRDETLENPVNDVELNVPVDGRIDFSDVTQEMIPDIKIYMDHLNLDIRSDKDGEARIVGVEAVLAAEMNIYQEETLNLLQDIYSPKVTLIPERKQIRMDNLVLKNQSRCPVREKVHLGSEGVRMLQNLSYEGQCENRPDRSQRRGNSCRRRRLPGHPLYCGG